MAVNSMNLDQKPCWSIITDSRNILDDNVIVIGALACCDCDQHLGI